MQGEDIFEFLSQFQFDIEFARDRFLEVLKAIPDTLYCIWLIPQKRLDFPG